MNAEANPTTYRVALPEFEGPLDLLLHLCKTHEIEIVNIPISFITTKYLEYLEIMQTMPVDIAADYLVMAATLAYLKSRELVPAPEPLEVAQDGDGDDEDGIDPRQELIRRLLEYQKYKDAAEKLGGRPIEGRNVFGRGAPVELSEDTSAPPADESVWKLIEAFGRILDKAKKGPVSSHNVIVDRVSIGTRIHQLVDRLQSDGGSFRFENCFDLSLSEPELRNQVVVTLLAILELARLKVIRVLQADDQETLFVTHVAGTDLEAARRVHVTSAEGEGDEAAEDADGVANDNEEGHDNIQREGDDMTAARSEGEVDSARGSDDESAADQTDAGSEFDEESAADATLVEAAPAGVQESEHPQDDTLRVEQDASAGRGETES
ncbi:MAG TPA: segregation/condensation protein A [Polyangia bacterium]|nr:segregation/condensation protein A [Polyangia bacterium]